MIKSHRTTSLIIFGHPTIAVIANTLIIHTSKTFNKLMNGIPQDLEIGLNIQDILFMAHQVFHPRKVHSLV